MSYWYEYYYHYLRFVPISVIKYSLEITQTNVCDNIRTLNGRQNSKRVSKCLYLLFRLVSSNCLALLNGYTLILLTSKLDNILILINLLVVYTVYIVISVNQVYNLLHEQSPHYAIYGVFRGQTRLSREYITLHITNILSS